MPRKELPTLSESLWRIKGTLLIQAIIITLGLITSGMTRTEHRHLLDLFGFDYKDLADGRIWHLLTGTWIQSTAGIEYSMIALVFGGTVVLELLAGTWAMLLTCISGDWVATFLTGLTLRVLSGLGNSTAAAILTTPDAGSSALAHAGYGAAVMLLPRCWLKVAIPTLILLTSIQFFIITPAAAIVHCWATVYGVLVGWFILRPRFGRELRPPLEDRSTTVSSIGTV